MILRSVVEYGCPISEQKWKMYDKESYVNLMSTHGAFPLGWLLELIGKVQ